MLVLVNSVLIPFFITLFADWEDFYSKSERQISIMNRNLFFMLINTLFIPLLGGPTLAAFFNDIDATSAFKIPELIAAGVLDMYDYFTVYFINLTFLSVGFWLLDLSHLLSKGIGLYSHEAD
jgi:hypothetical protein